MSVDNMSTHQRLEKLAEMDTQLSDLRHASMRAVNDGTEAEWNGIEEQIATLTIDRMDFFRAHINTSNKRLAELALKEKQERVKNIGSRIIPETNTDKRGLGSRIWAAFKRALSCLFPCLRRGNVSELKQDQRLDQTVKITQNPLFGDTSQQIAALDVQIDAVSQGRSKDQPLVQQAERRGNQIGTIAKKTKQTAEVAETFSALSAQLAEKEKNRKWYKLW